MPTPARPLPEKFQVAFSFAGEQRDLVRSIAEEVERQLGTGKIFFDEWFEAYIAGDDADLRLQKIYGEQCALAVVCVSERYGGKPWTLAEYAAVRARQMKARASANEHDKLGVLPIRVGEGEVEGILFNTIVPDTRTRPTRETAELIIARLRLIVPGLVTASDPPRPGTSWKRSSIGSQIMLSPIQTFRFDVAFSFAGPHREKVRAIAELVAERLGKERVFFDDWYEHEILGDDMDVLLQRFYHEQSLFVLADLSEEYADRRWCQAEARAIRALRFELDPARDETQRLRLLNVRFGSGELPGVFKTTAYLDGINKTAQQCADLVMKRLDLLRQRLAQGEAGASTSPPATFSWPETSAPLPIWPMANHSDARVAFEQLLTRNPPWRCLPLRGSTETGKSHITRQMLANAIQMTELACGRFDFKGTTDVDAEVRTLVQYLEVPLPPDSHRLNDRLNHILDALKQRAKPALLIFDTYEASGEAQDWIEKQLLLRVMRDSWLRVVVAGQTAPKATGAVWESIARAPLQLAPPSPEEWFAFGRQHKPHLTLEFVRQAYDFCDGKASVLAQLLGPGT